MSRLAYLLAHGVKEGLVASPYDWPGVHCARELVEGKAVSGRWHDRTLESKARRKSLPQDPRDFIVEEQLTLAPLPCWRSLEPAVYRARVQSLIEEIEARGRQRQEETGRSDCVSPRFLLVVLNPIDIDDRRNCGVALITDTNHRADSAE